MIILMVVRGFFVCTAMLLPIFSYCRIQWISGIIHLIRREANLMYLYQHKIDTGKSQQMIKVTGMVQEDIQKSGIKEGIAVVFSPHTTAGFTINENADPDVVSDMLYSLEKTFPALDQQYRHAEGNSHAHIKTTVCGPSQVLIIHEGAIVFGIWQDLYFCDFDGPRHRSFYVKIIKG